MIVATNTIVLLCALLLAATCDTARIPIGPRRQPHGDGGNDSKGWRPEERSQSPSQGTSPRRPGYVRMPVSRHVFNGTGKWTWGWHWSAPPGFPSGPGQWGKPPTGPGSPFPSGIGIPGGMGPGIVPGGIPFPGPFQQPTGGPYQGPFPPQPTGGAFPTANPFRPTAVPWPSGFGPQPSMSRAFSVPPSGPAPGQPTAPGWPPVLLPTTTASASASPSSSSLLATVIKPAETQASALSTNAVAQPPVVRRREEGDGRWGWSYLTDIGGIAYIIELEIGTPPQKIKVFIDTGSYELWVNPRCNTSASEAICENHGNYYPNKSNSSSYVGGDFAVTYGTGAVKGSYWSDIMSIAMFQIPSVQFAVANDSNYTFSGILGLGYSYPYSIKYPSVLNLMVSQKLISAPIFSVGLGGDGDNFSEIIFGGVNIGKFAGPLEPVSIWPPISAQDPRWIQYWINVTSVGITKPGEHAVIYTQRDNFTMPILIDTGSTLSYIREDLVAVIGQQFAATIDEAGNYIVNCSYRDKPGTVDFGFNRGRMVINIRYKDFIYQQIPGHCMLGVQPADVGSTNYVLGDTFIRGAYLVFDQQSDVIWMNQYYNCGDGVVTVGQTARDTQYIVGMC